MEYTVVADERLDVLVSRVNDRIFEGFKPLGGIVVTNDGESDYYYQTMLKEAE